MSEAQKRETKVRGNEKGHDAAADVGEDEGLIVPDVVSDELDDDAPGRPQHRHLSQVTDTRGSGWRMSP